MPANALPDRFQPRIAVVVVEGLTGRHLGDVGAWVKVVGVLERTRRRCANAAPTVDLPEPETPMTTIGDAISSTYPVVLDVTQDASIVIRLQSCDGIICL